MIEIEIDNKKLNVPEGCTIIEAADEAGIYIPRFCYHKKLSIAANCRMCLVEVEKVGKPLPACATPVTAGMKVFTQSHKALQAQRAVMEFLLINHPLDCPICDQGGECELQDLSMGFGRGFAQYNQPKRSVYNEDIGPLVETWMTRCIQCTRCVRFGEEIAGLRELGAVGRGEHTEIGTYVKHFLKSEISANIIDICPVGALTNKPARYVGRSWQYREYPAVSPHDAVGSNLFVHSEGEEFKKQRTVRRIVPRENDSINENWISDRDRYGVHGVYHEDRLYKPRMKKNGRWVEVEWKRALIEIADKLRGIIQNQGADQIAAIASPSATVEELYLLQKLMRQLGSNNIDHRYREIDFRDQAARGLYPKLDCSLAALEVQDAVLVLGSNVRYEQPMLNHRLRKAAQEGMPIFAVNPKNYTYTLPLAENWLVSPAELPNALAQITKAAAEAKQEKIAALEDVMVSDTARTIANKLLNAEKAAVLVGELVLNHPQAADMRAMLHYLKKFSNVSVGEMTSGANAAGAWLAGAIPHRGAAGMTLDSAGKDVKTLLTQSPVRAYLLMNVEPEYDFAYPEAALKAFDKAGLVVCFSPFRSEKMESYADFILPITPFTETEGTFVNMEGKWQSVMPATIPHGEARPGWKVLRVLANFLELEGFEYSTAHEVQFELKHLIENVDAEFTYSYHLDKLTKSASDLTRLAPWLIYRVDNLVRRSKPLQDVMTDYTTLAINGKTAERLGLHADELVWARQGEQSVNIKLTIDNRLADNTVWLPSGIAQTMGFGKGVGPIELTRVKP